MKQLTIIIFLIAINSCAHENSEQIKPNEKTPAYAWSEFSMGADLSYAAQLADKNISYKDSSVTDDIFHIFKKHGCNTVRLRLWHTPKSFSSEADQSYNDIDHVEDLMQKAKSAGMAVNLDLHYSDTWADPGKQFIPKAWASLEISTMKDSVYQYTLKTLNRLKAKDLVPEMIQIGNETNSGMLWPMGKTDNNNFAVFSQLLNSGIKAVRDFSVSSKTKPLIIIHVAQLQNADWWVGKVTEAGTTDFDVIGVSHYQDWSTLKTMAGISGAVKQLRTKYRKEVMIVETAYWWSKDDAAGNAISQNALEGYPFTPEGQYQYLHDLTQAVISAGGTGIQYWAPDYINSFGGEMTARSLVNFEANTLPGINFMTDQYEFPGK